MTVRYLYSGAGASSSPYTAADWNQAATAMSQIDGVDAAGDTIYVASDHSETQGTAQTYSFAGTQASPTYIVCASRSAAPPTASANGGSISTNAASASITFTAPGLLVNGLTIAPGSGQSTTCNIVAASATNYVNDFINCTLRLLSSGGSSSVNFAKGTNCNVRLDRTTVKFAAAGHSFRPSARFSWIGGGLEAGTTSPTNLIVPAVPCVAELTGLDLSAGAAGMNIFAG